MCGVLGVLDRTNLASKVLTKVNDAALTLAHRGPDSSGRVDLDAGVLLGHRRLAVVDLSEAGHQPMSSGDGRWTISYNGEIYNADEVRSGFDLTNFDFRGHSDTEILVESLGRQGVEAVVPALDGMFALAAWDSEEECLWLARDRFGEKPLYYVANANVVMFASEPRALLELVDSVPDVDDRALVDLVRYGQVVGDEAIFDGMRRVRPGEIIRFTRNSSEDRHTRYWQPGQVALAAKGAPRADVDEVARVLSESVRRRMVSDVPLGAFLSGGIDSSLVVALMQAQSDRPVKTFTIGFGDSRYNEAPFAAEVAERLGTDHTEWIMSESDVLEVIPKLARIYDEPFADSSQIPTFLVSHLARQHVTVALSGDGGDELFGGYVRYEAARRLEWVTSSPWAAPARWAAISLSRVSSERWNSLASGTSGRFLPRAMRMRLGERIHKLARVGGGGRGDFYDSLMSTNVDPSRFLDIPAAANRHAYRLSSYPFDSIMERAMLADTEIYLPDDILTKVDRASMANSLEVRVPMLSPEVFDVAWRLPLDLKIANGQGKVALRAILKRHLPAELVDRPKMGFGVPLATWLRGPLRDWAEGLLSKSSLDDREVWKTEAVREAWASHLSGRADQSVELWPVLMYQAWADEWLR